MSIWVIEYEVGERWLVSLGRHTFYEKGKADEELKGLQIQFPHQPYRILEYVPVEELK